MLESIFQFLFKYRPVVFERGSFVLDPPVPALVVVAGAALVAAVAAQRYRRTGGRLDGRDRVVLTALRAAAVALLTFCLLRPMLVVATVVPQANFLGILLDDSRSMQVADTDNRTRHAVMTETFGSAETPLISALADRFKLRFFRFSETARRLADSTELTFAGRRTDLGRALDGARRELAGVPLAGLVVVTDGAENGADGSLAQSILQLQSDGVPVYAVGLGAERFTRDIALRHVTAPRRVLAGSSVAVDVAVGQSGFGGDRADLILEDDGQILATREFTLPRDGDVTTVRLTFTADAAGPRRLRFRIEPREGEAVVANNEIERLVSVEDTRPRVLYFEGEPRFEVKFLRRAVAEDDNVRLVVLQRTAEEKFYAIDVDAEDDLATGFPNTREELFRYDGLVLGSIEASFFTYDQLSMITEFVGRRGGGLLVLGGRRSFAEGGYAETPLAEALPVVLDRERSEGPAVPVTEIRVRPTPFGLSHPVTQLAPTPEESESRWASVPPLTSVNRLAELKPAASALLEGEGDGLDDPVAVLAYQRYGRGKALALSVQDTWLWQMHADVAVDDLMHETFWRQLLRWLVADVPAHVTLTADADWIESGSTVTVTAEVADSGYLRLNGADVSARVVAPDGSERTVPMEWSVERDGEYRATVVAEQDGLYEFRAQATRGGEALGEDAAFVQTGDLDSELRTAELQAQVLRRIAQETGGRYYTPSTVAALAEDVSFTESGTTIREERDLWDMPILLTLLLSLIGTEWIYRRTRGLA